MLFDASNVYAPDQPRGYAGNSASQDMSQLGQWHLDQVKMPNVWLGLAGLAVVAYLVHRSGGKRR